MARFARHYVFTVFVRVWSRLQRKNAKNFRSLRSRIPFSWFGPSLGNFLATALPVDTDLLSLPFRISPAPPNLKNETRPLVWSDSEANDLPTTFSLLSYLFISLVPTTSIIMVNVEEVILRICKVQGWLSSRMCTGAVLGLLS